MPEIIKSLTFEDLPTRPPLVGRPRISDDIQQTAALLCGWDGATRRLVRVSPTGALYTASHRVKGILNIQADGDADDYQGGDVSTTEVMIRAKTTNTGTVWVNVHSAGAVDTGYPLLSSEWVRWSINNLHSLHLHFTKGDDWVIVVYTK